MCDNGGDRFKDRVGSKHAGIGKALMTAFVRSVGTEDTANEIIKGF
jgi:hypothetical protein